MEGTNRAGAEQELVALNQEFGEAEKTVLLSAT